MNRGEWRAVESKVADAVERLRSPEDYIRFTVKLVYANPSKTRPHQLNYKIERMEGGSKEGKTIASILVL